MSVHVQRSQESVKASCSDCDRRGRRGALVFLSASNSGGLGDWLRRHERHGRPKAVTS